MNEDMELDPQLGELSTSTLHRLYVSRFGGFDLLKTFRERAKNPEDAKDTTGQVDKALKAALTDLHVLVSALEGAEKLPKTHKPKALSKSEREELADKRFSGGEMLVALLHRLRDGWDGLDVVRRDEVLEQLKVTGKDDVDKTPAWPDLLAMFSEIEAMNRHDGDGDSLPVEWYEAIVERHEAVVSAKAAKKKKAPVRPVFTPPPEAQIVTYSPRATFRFGQWIRHPKFGVGCVVEAGDHLTVEFEHEQKRLVHVPVPMEKLGVNAVESRKSNVDTAELARASGVTITKLPPQVLDD
jgi:hypothetical protein